MMRGEPFRGRTIAAADVADVLSGAPKPAGRPDRDQRLDRLIRSLIAFGPEAVMDVLAPDLAIERVELIVMLGNVGGGLDLPRSDHRAASAAVTDVSCTRVSDVRWRMAAGQARQR